MCLALAGTLYPEIDFQLMPVDGGPAGHNTCDGLALRLGRGCRRAPGRGGPPLGDQLKALWGEFGIEMKPETAKEPQRRYGLAAVAVC